MGPAKEMPTGPLMQSMQPSDYEDPAAADYVNDLVDKHSQEGVSIPKHTNNAHLYSLLRRTMNTEQTFSLLVEIRFVKTKKSLEITENVHYSLMYQ
jgi:hypothetical protein